MLVVRSKFLEPLRNEEILIQGAQTPTMEWLCWLQYRLFRLQPFQHPAQAQAIGFSANGPLFSWPVPKPSFRIRLIARINQSNIFLQCPYMIKVKGVRCDSGAGTRRRGRLRHVLASRVFSKAPAEPGSNHSRLRRSEFVRFRGSILI